MRILTAILATTLLLTGSAASAQTATDAQCLILSNIFAKQAKDQQSQQAAQAAVFFYMGRVRSGISAAQLKTLMEEAAKPITNDNAGSKMTECVKTLQATGQLLQSISPPPPAAAATTQPAKPQTQPQGR